MIVINIKGRIGGWRLGSKGRGGGGAGGDYIFGGLVPGGKTGREFGGGHI